MRRLLLLMMIMSPLIAFCQSEKSERRLRSIGIVVSPDFTYRNLTYASSNQWIAQIRNGTEVGNVGFTAGAQLRFRVKNKMNLETGLLYSNKSLATKFQDLVWTSIDPAFPERGKMIYHFKYLVFPLNISYNFRVRESISLFATTGMAANIFLSKKTNVVTEGGNNSSHASSKQTGYSKVNLSVMIGMGIDYRLSKRIILRAVPFYQRSLSSIVVDPQAKEYLFSFGVNSGVHYLL